MSDPVKNLVAAFIKKHPECASFSDDLEELLSGIGALQKENAVLQSEIEALRAKVKRLELHEQYEREGESDFIEASGVLWRPAVSGGVESLVYCPDCQLVLTPFPSDYPTSLVCTKCRFKAAFGPDEISSLAERLGN